MVRDLGDGMNKKGFYCRSDRFPEGLGSVVERIIILATQDYREMKRLGIIQGTFPDVTIHFTKAFRKDYTHAGNVQALITYLKDCLQYDLSICGAGKNMTAEKIIKEIDK